jgi:sugar/nucleoside kinase (ribokinase family)
MVAANGDRKFLHRMGASEIAFSAPLAFTAELIEGMAHYHLSSLFIVPNLRRHAPECLERARAAGLTTSLDTNWDPLGEWMAVVAPCLPHVDIVFMNEDEARMTTGSTDPKVAAHCLLGAGAKIAVMKLGARGCAIYTGSEEIFCPAYDVNVMDTTGAGDCFVGAFLAAWLQNRELKEAGRFANAVAAISVQRLGGVAGLETHIDVEAWMRSARLRPYSL